MPNMTNRAFVMKSNSHSPLINLTMKNVSDIDLGNFKNLLSTSTSKSPNSAVQGFD